jgi:hypothetical protein
MHRVRRLQRWAACIALVAIGALALLPTVSHALAGARSEAAALAAICTPQGLKELPSDAPAPSFEHCALCTLAADAPPLVPAQPALALPAGGAAAVPALFLHAPRTLHAWAAAQPRAPPPVSETA